MFKDQVDAEAKKAAEKIRGALEEFNKATGLSAEVETRWVDYRVLSESKGRTAVEYVLVKPEHPSVKG